MNSAAQNTSTKSKRHRKLLDSLITFIPQAKIVNEFHIGHGLHIDIFMPSYGIGIEIDGEQHYSQNSFFHKSEEDFSIQRMLDKKKELLAKENGIILLYRLRFDDQRDFGEIVKDIFNKYNKLGDTMTICQSCGEDTKLIGSFCVKCLRSKRDDNDSKRKRYKFGARKNRTRNYISY